ncbi:MAG: penicillin-binding protein [Saprospiraceae bacterium]|nr:transpeptidase family protein [Lewinellaceae bacterium]
MLNIKNEVLVRVYLLAAVVLLVAFVITGRLYQLSVVQAPKWEAKADSLFLKFVDVEADRGNVLAADGSLLATSLPFFDAHFDVKAEGLTDEAFNANLDSLAWMLSTYIDQQYTPGAYKEWLIALREADPNTRGIRYVPIAKNLSYYKMQMIKNFPLFRLGRYKGGLIVEQRSERERPFKLLAQRTIGYVRDGALPVGLEGSFDKVLGGSKGKQLMLRVPGDVYIPVSDLAEIEPNAGDDIVTTLDINIQDVAENALLRACKAHEADHGCAIVMEVKTGAIRAIANIGRTENGNWWETYNYAVGERVEPGSMFKLASFMAMIEDGHLDDFDAKIPVYGGKVKFYKEDMVDAYLHGQDSMTIREVFAKSSNVGTATMVQQYYGDTQKPGAFVKRLRGFGLDRATEIEIGGEELPILKDPNDPKTDWSGTTLPWMSIGYEMLMTPLQLLTFYNAVANNGRMMKPFLVDRIEHYGETVKEFRPVTVKRNIASRETIKKAKELLAGVVQPGGTAQNIRSSLYTIAGKTGTAQLNYHKFKSRAGIRHQAGFCGFFPAENPVYSCIVVISEPKRGGYHGSEAAAPVFKEIADKCFALKAAVHPPVNAAPRPVLASAQLPTIDAGQVEDIKLVMDWLNMTCYAESDMPDWGVLRPTNDSLYLLPRIVQEKRIPSVVGMGLKDAIYLLENRGCRVRVKGIGKVVRQSLAPGTPVSGRPSVILYLN